MATIIPISGKTGTRWRATVKKFAGGKLVINKSRTFEKQKSAETWARKLEAELDTPEGLAAHTGHATRCTSLADLINRYVSEVGATKPLGETKSTVLRILSESPFAQRPANEVTSQDVVAFCRDRNRINGTGAAALAQYVMYLRQVLAIARPAWGVDVTTSAADDAKPVLKAMGLSGQGASRDRRLEGDEQARLLEWLTRYQSTRSRQLRMADIFEFAIASAMRRGEIARIMWRDINEVKRTIIIRDRKDPQQKIGNDQEVPLLGAAWDVIQRQPRTADRIFPVSEVAISKTFAYACEVLGIDDLHFHDLRHEATSRLFEQGYQIQEVAIVTGHRSWDMLKRYTQLRPESLHRD